MDSKIILFRLDFAKKNLMLFTKATDQKWLQSSLFFNPDPSASSKKIHNAEENSQLNMGSKIRNMN